MPTEEKAKPDSWGYCLEQGTATNFQGLRAAVHQIASNETYIKYRSQIPLQVSRVASTGMQRPIQQLTAQQGWECSMPMSAPLGEQDPAEPTLCEAEPSQELETKEPARELHIPHDLHGVQEPYPCMSILYGLP